MIRDAPIAAMENCSCPNVPSPLEIRLRALSALDYAPGTFSANDASVWPIRPLPIRSLKSLTGLPGAPQHLVLPVQTARPDLSEKKPRSDKHHFRKVQPAEIAEALHEILPAQAQQGGYIPKSVLYEMLIEKQFFSRSQLSPTSFTGSPVSMTC